MKDRPDQSSHKEPIAIVGIGCRFPGSVNSPATFWQLMRDGVDAITEIPNGRFDIEAYYHPVPKTPGKIVTQQGGFLADIDHFDAHFFGISPREADYMDPQQRLLLEVAWEALEDGGQVPGALASSRTGVFIGMWTNEYEDVMYQAFDDINLYTTTGGGRYAASGRLSYFFDFRGPSLTVDTACSSSLVAVHLACRSLWNGDSTLALAGGVNLLLEPQISIGYSRSGMLSPDARCKFGDVRADGYVRSEGVGIVVLKPLTQALADDDPIYALIRGSAVNNDGRSSELLVAPGRETQIAMLREAYRDAGVSPKEIDYVEAHGTGTKAGDHVEIQALGRVLGEGRSVSRPCAIGSIKTNIGHTEAASGIAGLIKAALCLKHRAIPASLHFETPTPAVPWSELPVVIQHSYTDWPEEAKPAFAGVNSFGVTGTNAHVVLQEPPRTTAHPISSQGKNPYLIPLSARSPVALHNLVRTMLSEGIDESLADLAYTTTVRRTHHEYRLALVTPDSRELAAQLEAFLQDEPDNRFVSAKVWAERKPKIVFIFPGQGSQWSGMGRELLAREPVFRQVLEQCDAAIRLFTDWSLVEQLSAGEDAPAYRLDQIDVIQPTLLSIEIALAELWRSWGIQPDAVIGHSMGEVAAAYIAGALSLEDAMRIICRRSQLLRRTSGLGAMAMVELTIEEAQAVLAGYEDRLSIAVNNSPRSTVLSGDPAALDEVITALQARDVFCRLIKVDVASHSPQMDPLKPDLLAALTGLQPRAAAVPIYSTALSMMTDGSHFDAEYWVQNLRRPVHFSQMTHQLLADDHNVFIEMSPHPILLPAVQQGFQHNERDGITLASMRRGEPERATLLNSLGALYTVGYPIDWSSLYSSGRCVALPSYPWQRERFWYDASATQPKRPWVRPGAHPFLERYLSSATGSDIWETELAGPAFSYLQDHRVGETAVFPAAAVVEMVLAAAREAYGEGPHLLENVSFEEMLVLPANGMPTIQLIVTEGIPGLATFQLFGRASEEGEMAAWTQYATGSVRLGKSSDANEAASLPQKGQVAATAVTSAAHYGAMSARGLPYGPAFQGVTRLWPRPAGVVADLELPVAATAATGSYHLHPSLLDAGFQLLLATLGEDDAQSHTYLPVHIKRVWISSNLNLETGWRGQAVRHSHGDELVGDVFLYDAAGQVQAAVYGLSMQRLPQAQTAEVEKWLYEIAWQPRPFPEQMTRPANSRWLIFADETGLSDALVTRLERAGSVCITVTAGDCFQQVGSKQYVLDPAQPELFRSLLETVTQNEQALDGLIYLWSLNSHPEAADLRAAQDWGIIGILHLVQAIAAVGLEAARLWLVTRAAQAVAAEPVNVAQAPVWGMSRVIANEHPELKCTCIDLDANGTIELLSAELATGELEQQVAYRDGVRYVARLVRLQAETATGDGAGQRRVAIDASQSYCLEISTPGILDNLHLYLAQRRAPGPDEVEIEISATGLNFLDVMKAMGIKPGLDPNETIALGAECAGVVTAVGVAVEGIQIGDEVIAITPSFDEVGFFRGYVTIPEEMVIPKPTSLTFAEAATLPLTFLTAYYALHYLGRMEKGERVLIHLASGGVGLAAVQMAQQAGAEIFATAGNPKKRAYLRQLGIQHVMDSRSLDFAQEVMEQTDGRGVDLVLNSLTGEALRQSFAVLAPYGRFLEIGKRDIYQNSALGLEPFKKNLSFFAIDLARLVAERPSLVMTLLKELMAHFETGQLRPLPLKQFAIAEVGDAFRYMAQAQHVGKIVVTHERENLRVWDGRRAGFRADGTYLITGGLGGLGLTVARWLVGQGARHLVLAGRSRASAAAQGVIDELKAQGAHVDVASADVSDRQAVANLLRQLQEAMPPLRGVIHAAGILDDRTLLQMDRGRLLRVMAPKLEGAWNLHTLTQDADLDFFVLFSSVASLLGTPGQSNYAAANAFLDALAHHRRAQGLPALSINWGPWSEVGLAAARANRGQRLAQRGLGSLNPAQGIAALARLMSLETGQTAVMPFHLSQWAESYPAAQKATFFEELRQAMAANHQPQSETSNLRQLLLAAEPGRPRRALLEAHLQSQVAQVLRQSPSRIPLNRPLKTLGLDSLMTLELRNRLENTLNLALSATLIFNYPTVMALAPYLAGKMGIALEKAASATAESTLEAASGASAQDQGDDRAELDELSQDDVVAMLAEELAAVDDLLLNRIEREEH